MAGTTDELLTALKPGATLGPEHHRFRLRAQPAPHPLGTLWPAEDISTPTPTPVSLLFLSSALLEQPGFVDQLRDRLNRSRTLHDPFIATCFGYFNWRGLFFISWDLAESQTLQQLFDTHKVQRFTDRQKQGLVTQVARALEAGLNETRAPHAALAPELIHLLPAKGIRVLGFGWRPLLEPVSTRLSPPLNYRAWQAPESFHPNPLDASADVYALAALIYQIYAGKPAFTESEGEASRQRELKPPGGLSKAQWRVLKTALSLAPEQRPGSPLELVRQLYRDSATESAAEPTPEPAPLSIDAGEPESKPAAQASTAVKQSETAHSQGNKLAWLSAWRKPRPPVQAAGMLFAAGLALGFWLGWQLSTAEPVPVPSAPLVTEETPTTVTAPRAADINGADTPNDPMTAHTASDNAAPPSPADAAPVPPTVRDGQALRAAPKAADNLTIFQDSLPNGGVAPQMVLIPSGRFRMGDLHGQGDDNEKPVHEVIISRRYALSRFEVTFAEYDSFADATGRARPDDEGWGRGAQPVVNVSWEDANAYVRWLAEQSGQPYRLPTEAEWEYAARAGTETLYWWGDELTPGRAVCDECGTAWDGRQPAPVGRFAPNPWGLHDLNGNVDEWVQDCYQETYAGAPTDGSARQDSGCAHRVMRGGSWFDIGRLVRSASRYRHPPNTARNSWGFRVALDLPPTD